MPTVTLRTEQDVEDLLRGLVLLGTGGGGHPRVGRRYLMRHVQAGQPMRLTDISEVPDDAWTCCVFGMGSVAPHPPLSEVERARLGYVEAPVEYPMVEAVRELAEYTGREIQALVSFEPGAVATACPLDVATRMDILMVDADYCGRAVPKLSQTMPALAGHTLWPAAICDTWGNRLVLKHAPSSEVAETLGKTISVVTKRPDAFAICAHAGFLLPAREMKQMAIPGTLSRAYTVGAAVRAARQANCDPVGAAASALDGWVLFEGTIVRWEWESRDGYMFGTNDIKGEGRFAGHSMKIWLQNENHVAWLDDAPYVTSPDMIMVINAETGEPCVNTDLADGLRVGVLGAQAAMAYRTPAGLAAMGPTHYGYDIPYRAIEAVLGPSQG
jgi:DUF917 family protein